jgi:hypothetical protein
MRTLPRLTMSALGDLSLSPTRKVIALLRERRKRRWVDCVRAAKPSAKMFGAAARHGRWHLDANCGLGAVSWVTMLDQRGLPNNGPNSQKPRRFMRSVTYAGDEYYPTPEHYLFGLYSKFVLPGARRIQSTYGSADTVTDVAFQNPDGTIATVVINQTSTVQEFVLRSEGNQIWAALDAKTATTLVWRAGLGNSSVPATRPTK